MTSPTIEVVEATPKAAEHVVPVAKAAGWLAFHSPNPNADGTHCWQQATIPYDPGYVRDMYRCPYPLFATKQDALDSCAKSLSNGGSIRLFRIEL